MTILDDSVLDGERNFSIRLVEASDEDGRSGRAEIDDNSPAINIHIDLDFEDGKSHSVNCLTPIRRLRKYLYFSTTQLSLFVCHN